VLASEITGLVNLKQIHNSRSALQQQVFSVEKDHWCFFFYLIDKAIGPCFNFQMNSPGP
jgi:hypothetical protein